MSVSKLNVFAPTSSGHHLAGRISWENRKGSFCYAKEWLEREDGYALDPRNLPLESTPFVTTVNGGIHGVFSDAGPDAWGKRLFELEFGRKPVSGLELLLESNGGGSGSLLFSEASEPSVEMAGYAPISELANLELAAFMIGAKLPVERDLQERLFIAARSIGGARPKANIFMDGATWIAKFSSPNDLIDMPRQELACLELARHAGIDVPDHKIVEVNGRSALLVRRFDTADTGPVHYLSLNALLSLERISSSDLVAPDGLCTYGGLAELCKLLGAQKAGRTLFQRMAFNILIGNTDDHLRNHGLLLGPDGWHLSAAFDLTSVGGDNQAIGVGNDGRSSTIDNAFSDFARFGLLLEEAHSIFESTALALQDASDFLSRAGLPPSHIEGSLALMNSALASFDRNLRSNSR